MDNKRKFTQKDVDNLNLTVSDKRTRIDFTPGHVPPINEKTLSALMDKAKVSTTSSTIIDHAINDWQSYYITESEREETTRLATNLSGAFSDHGVASIPVNEAWEELKTSARKNPATRDFLRHLGVNHEAESEYEEDIQENAIDLLKHEYHMDMAHFGSKIETMHRMIAKNDVAVTEYKELAEEFDEVYYKREVWNENRVHQFERRVTQIAHNTDQFLNHLHALSNQDREWTARMTDAAVDPRIPLSPYRQAMYTHVYTQLQEQRNILNIAVDNLIREAENLAEFNKDLGKDAFNLYKSITDNESFRKEAENESEEISKQCYIAGKYVIDSIKSIDDSLTIYKDVFREEEKITKDIKETQEYFNNIKDKIHNNVKTHTESSIVVGIPIEEGRPLLYEALRGEPKIISVLNDLGSITNDDERDLEIKARIGINKLFGLENDAEMRIALQQQPLSYNNLKLEARLAITNALRFEHRDGIRSQVQELASTKTDDELRETLAALGEPDSNDDSSADSWEVFIELLKEESWQLTKGWDKNE